MSAEQQRTETATSAIAGSERPGKAEREFTHQISLGLFANGRSDKIGNGRKFDGAEKIGLWSVERGGDDISFVYATPYSVQSEGLLVFGGVLDGVSQGGRGDQASLAAAQALIPRLDTFFSRIKYPPMSRDEIEWSVVEAIVAANDAVNHHREQLWSQPDRGGLEENVMGTTLALFAVQESEGKLYLHTWYSGDSQVLVFVGLDDGRKLLFPVVVPHDIWGEGAQQETGFVNEVDNDKVLLRSQDPAQTGSMTTEDKQQRYKAAIAAFVAQHGKDRAEDLESMIRHAIGFNKKRPTVNYERIALSAFADQFAGSRVINLKVTALTDGVTRYVSFDNQVEACSGGSMPHEWNYASQTAQQLARLSGLADADDRSAAVIELRPSRSKADELLFDLLTTLDILQKRSRGEVRTPDELKKAKTATVWIKRLFPLLSDEALREFWKEAKKQIVSISGPSQGTGLPDLFRVLDATIQEILR